MRLAAACARGTMMNIIENIRNANMICMAYCRKAAIAPICMVPLSIRLGAEPHDGQRRASS